MLVVRMFKEEEICLHRKPLNTSKKASPIHRQKDRNHYVGCESMPSQESDGMTSTCAAIKVPGL